MTQSNSRKSAFPSCHEDSTSSNRVIGGLTKREWLAGVALGGLAAGAKPGLTAAQIEVMARDAVDLADSVLIELEGAE